MTDDLAQLQKNLRDAASHGAVDAGQQAVWAGVAEVESPWRSLDSDAKPVVTSTEQLSAQLSTARPRGVFQEGGGAPAVLTVDPTGVMAQVAAEAGARAIV